MAEPAIKLPIKSEEEGVERRAESWLPCESLKSEIDRSVRRFRSKPVASPLSFRRPHASGAGRRVGDTRSMGLVTRHVE